jgi:hypothetical protein
MEPHSYPTSLKIPPCRGSTNEVFDWCQDKLGAVFFGCSNNNRNSSDGKPELMGKDH